MHCFACGESIALASGERVAFRDSCPRCATDLHICRNCSYYDPGAYNACRESNAEWVADRERANRCDYFSPGRGAPDASGGGTELERAHAALKSLFGKS